MGFIPQQQANTGLYIATTNVYDVAEIYEIDVNSPEFKELLVRLYQNANNMALALNQKDSGLYQTQEFVDGQVWFNPNSSRIIDARSDFRKVVNFGPLPDTTTKSVAHNIPIAQANQSSTFNPYSFTRIYATASCQNPTTGLSYIPIPYSSVSSVIDDIEIFIDETYVNIKTAIDYSKYTICYVVLEYLKN